MPNQSQLPVLITFDGEARTGKGTIVKRTKLMLESKGHSVRLIDGGQIFRAFAVCAEKQNIDLDDPSAVDFFLDHDDTKDMTVGLLNQTAAMTDEAREAILYTPHVSVQCAKIATRPQSHVMAQQLTHAWVKSAVDCDVVFLDGRVLEHLAEQYESEGMVRYKTGFYFICDERIGAKRFLGYSEIVDTDLTPGQSNEVEEMTNQIHERNQRDFERQVKPLKRPDVVTLKLPTDIHPGDLTIRGNHNMAIIDTSAHMSKDEMSAPMLKLIAEILQIS